jgi:molybdopterin-containing oxidoreductase family membrane subunit
MREYLAFLRRCFIQAFSGDRRFYAWMIFLTAVMLVGLNAFVSQLVSGLGATNMSDHVSWGLYIANLTYIVGLAAGAVLMVIPAYLYRNRAMHDVVIVGEILAIAAIIMCLAFVVVDIGRPDRFWHIIPGIGRFHWPVSMLAWDVIVLTGYLLLNFHVCGYLMYTRFRGRTPDKRWYLPFVLLSIVWAVSIHTVTAFLYAGLGGRPFWNSAILAPRFIASAFVTGPAFIIVTLQLVRRLTRFPVADAAIQTLVSMMRITVLANLFFLGSELFTEFYTQSAHVDAARYLYFGLHGHHALVPWIWSAVALNITSAIIFLTPASRHKLWLLDVGCVAALAGIWIEKGMGLIIPGFVPSTLHEIVEYTPNLLEWRVSAGIWAFGLAILTIGLKMMTSVYTDDRANSEAQA